MYNDCINDFERLIICFFFLFFVTQEEDDDWKTKQWPAARLTRSATLPRKSRAAATVVTTGSLACSSGGDGCGEAAGIGCRADKSSPAVKKAYPSSGSSGYNSLPRMNGGGRKSAGGGSSVKHSPSELSYKMAAAAVTKPEEDVRKQLQDSATTDGGHGNNFDSSYSCDEISVNDSSITLTIVSPPAKAKTAADLRREYFRGPSKYGSATGSCGSVGRELLQKQQQQQQQQYFNRGGGSVREKQAIASSLHKYFDNSCKIK